MKKQSYLFIMLLLSASVYFTSCSNDPENADVTIELEHMFGSSGFNLNNETYTNASGDSLEFTTLKYYISNIRLLKTGGEGWSETESYHLVDLSSAATTTITLSDVEAAEYTGIQFLIGVDSARNVSGAQTGALDPANNMFWSWNTGYIFLKAEGNSPQSSSGSFAYHIGGFQGANAGLRWITLDFGANTLIVQEGNENMSHLSVDVKKLFDGSTYTLSTSLVNNQMMVSTTSSSIADNYAEMFAFDHNHN